MSKVNTLSDEEFRVLVASSESYTACLKSLGLSGKGGTSSKLLKARIHSLQICTAHFKGAWSKRSIKYTLEDVLIVNSPYTNISKLKKRLVQEGVLEYLCAVCSNPGEWMGKQLVLQLDHVNGIYNDHRIENLRFLCPNCHSQTETFSGRNKGSGLGDQS